MLRQLSLICFATALISLTACRANNESENGPAPSSETRLVAEANNEPVLIKRDGEQQPLPVEEQTGLSIGDGLAVAENGRATLRLTDLLTVELFQAGEVILKGISTNEESTVITLQQNGGVLLGDFRPSPAEEHRLMIETGFATLTTAGARFAVVREANTPLKWVVNLGPEAQASTSQSADDGEVQVTTAELTRTLSEDTARWIAPDGSLSDPVAADSRRLQAWLNNAQQGDAELTLSEVLLSPANTIGNTEALTSLASPGRPFTLGENEQGAVRLVLDPIGVFGDPAYRLEDCNGDGNQDIVMQAGKLIFDFRSLLSRVLAVDVTVINRDQPDNGALWGLNPAGEEIAREILEVGANQSQTLSLRADQPFHAAELALSNGCFLGFSLTPPTATGAPSEPRAAATVEPGDIVVNILAEPEQDIADRSQIVAIPTNAGAIDLDGAVEDWEALTRQSDLAWIRFDTVVYDEGCATRHPEAAASSVDLSSQVMLAYDERNLYVAFQVEDDGYVGYLGTGENYFSGDSPQLSLDMDLPGDINDSNRSADDWQIDFLPDPDSPRVALWQLGSLTARQFDEADVAVSSTADGYFLEAALPWQSFGVSPQAGDRLGLAANVNDNDTPGSNAQECIISTAPEREWNVPTTWGTLLLRPAGE